MAKPLIAAVLLAAALVAAVVVPAAMTRGSFAFDAWPEAPRSHARDEQVAISEPARRSDRVRSDNTEAARGGNGAGGSAAAPHPRLAARARPQRPSGSADAATPESRPGRQQQTDDAPAAEPPALDDEQLAETPPPPAATGPAVEARPVVVEPPVVEEPVIIEEPAVDPPAVDPPRPGLLPRVLEGVLRPVWLRQRP